MENQRHNRCIKWETEAENLLANEKVGLPTIDEIQESAARGLISCFQANAMTRAEVVDFMSEQFPDYTIPEDYWNQNIDS